jgi:hypothetical protein
MPAHLSASARSPKERYWIILPLRNTKPSANRPPTHSVESFRRTQAWRYTTTLSPFTKNFSGSQAPSAQVSRPFVTCSCTSIGAGCWKALGFNAHNLRIKIFDDGLHIIAIDCSEELFECFSFGAHGSHSRTSLQEGHVRYARSNHRSAISALQRTGIDKALGCGRP